MKLGLMLSPMGSLRVTQELTWAFHRYAHVDVDIHDLPLDEVPVQPPYADQPLPAAGTAWKARITELDGLIVVVRARTRSVPGHLKIGIDWASQPEPVNTLRGMPVLVVAVGEGERPSFLALQHARTVLADAGANVMKRPDYSILLTDNSFTPDGLVEDPELAERITDIIHSAAGFTAHHRRAESLELPELPALVVPVAPTAASVRRLPGPVM